MDPIVERRLEQAQSCLAAVLVGIVSVTGVLAAMFLLGIGR